MKSSKNSDYIAQKDLVVFFIAMSFKILLIYKWSKACFTLSSIPDSK